VGQLTIIEAKFTIATPIPFICFLSFLSLTRSELLKFEVYKVMYCHNIIILLYHRKCNMITNI